MRAAMYILLLSGLAALLYTAGIGYGWFSAEHRIALHWQVALWAVLLLLLAHTVVLFYFLATGKQLRTLMQGSGRQVNSQYLADMRLFKNKVFPWVMGAQFSTIATFVVGGGVLVRAVPPALHTVLALIAIVSNFVGAVIEIRYIERNRRLILAIEREYLEI